MVRIDLQYEGELRCRAVHAPSAADLATDAPTDNHGRGESFSPTDLLATALGTCMLTVMGIHARKHDWDLAGATASVEKDMVDEPARRVARLAVEIRVPTDPGETARGRLEEVARTCPVALSLSHEIDVPVRFAWGA